MTSTQPVRPAGTSGSATPAASPAKVFANSPILEATAAELVDRGFPAAAVTAFKAAAQDTGCVIISRPPGKAAGMLIEAGYDLKSMYVHTKSCDWGPMAGFVCQLPPLNKTGAAGAEQNLRWNKEVVDNFRALRTPDAKPVWGGQPGVGTPSADAKAMANICFTPLVVPAAVFEVFWGDEPPAMRRETVESSTTVRYGLTSRWVGSGDRKTFGDVVVEYVAKKGPGEVAWTLFHRQVWTRPRPDAAFTPYVSTSPDGSRLLLAGEDVEANTAEPAGTKPFSISFTLSTTWAGQTETVPQRVADELTGLRGTVLAGGALPNPLQVFRLRGVQNPYPPYSKDWEHNAITGDYDLFAVWPAEDVPLADMMSMSRYSEAHSGIRDVDPDGQGRMLLRPYTVDYHRNLYVEVVPTVGQLKAAPEMAAPGTGNISDTVLTAAQALNSRVGAIPRPDVTRRPNLSQFPNFAYHGDEGGRPDVTALDVPVVAFLPWAFGAAAPASTGPDALSARPPGPAFVITSYDAFLDVLIGLRPYCRLQLHAGWFTSMLVGETKEGRPDADRTLTMTGTGTSTDTNVRRCGGERLAGLLTGTAVSWPATGSPPPWYTNLQKRAVRFRRTVARDAELGEVLSVPDVLALRTAVLLGTTASVH